MLVSLLLFIVKYIFLKQFVKLLMVKYTYLPYLLVSETEQKDWCYKLQCFSIEKDFESVGP